VRERLLEIEKQVWEMGLTDADLKDYLEMNEYEKKLKEL
jgi:hypothetical protein